MGVTARVLGGLLCTGALACGQAAAPLEAYGRLPNLENVAISPDGSKLAFVRTSGDLRAVAVASLADRKLIAAGRLGEIKLRTLRWADDDHLMLISSKTGLPWGLVGKSHEWYMLSVFEVSTHKINNYPKTIDEISMMNVIAGQPMIRRLGKDTFLFIPGIYATDRTELALFKVNLRTGDESTVRLGTETTRGWLVDEAGEIIAENNYTEWNQRWQLKIRRGRHLAEAVSRQVPIDVPEILGFGPDGESILLDDLVDGDPVWRLVSLRDGKLGPALEERGGLSEPIEDPKTHRLIGGIRTGDETEYVFFDPSLKSRWGAVVSAFEGERVELVSASQDLMKFVVRVDGPRHGFEYELVDMNTAQSMPLGKVYDDVSEIMDVRPISYPAADGMKIPAYLTLPAGKPAKKLPLLVFPHGGPADRDTARFDWWAQAMASQGYAVLQPNFRGSAIDWSFTQAGFGEWGRKMQTDLSDGVRYLDKEGIIDPKRVCIIGASYGGYASLAGVTLDPGVYRCAVSVAGVSDLKAFLIWVKQRESAGDHISQRYWDRFMGVQNYKDLSLDAISPIHHIDNVNVPVMLIHGRDDTVVPFEQSDIIYNALQKAHKSVELVTLKNEDHWLSRNDTRLQMLQSAMAFIKAHNPPD